MALFAFSINKPLQKTSALGHRDEMVSYQNYLYVLLSYEGERKTGGSHVSLTLFVPQDITWINPN